MYQFFDEAATAEDTAIFLILPLFILKIQRILSIFYHQYQVLRSKRKRKIKKDTVPPWTYLFGTARAKSIYSKPKPVQRVQVAYVWYSRPKGFQRV
eukprot:SAG31_NODE_1772_length_7306_cov_3.341335_6_plen_96_part_00